MNGISFFLGSNGKFTKVTGNEINVPFIFGDFKKRNFYELKKAIDDSNFNYKEIKNLFFFQSGRWDIETNYGLLIKQPKDNLKDSLKLFTSFIAENYKKNINIIDLRQYNQIIINGK